MSKVKKITTLLFICFIAAYFIGCSSQKSSSEVVAKVNGKEITREQLDKSLESERKQLERITKDANKEKIDQMMKALEGKILDNLINREIILQEAEKQGVVPSDKDIDNLINNIIAKYGSKEKFEVGLQKTNSNLTIEEYKQMQKERMSMTNLFQIVTKDIKVNDSDLKKYYNENKYQFSVPVKIKRILVKFDSTNEKVGRTEAEALKEAQSIINNIKAGGDFSKLAQEKSDESITKDIGGDFYYNPQFQQNIDPAILSAIKALKPGGLTAKPIKVIGPKLSGYYIIRYVSASRQKSYEEAKATIKQQVSDIKKSEKWQEYNRQLIKSAKVEKLIK